MSIYFAVGEDTPSFLCSNTGWGEFTAWVDEQSDMPETRHLIDHGWNEPASDVLAELTSSPTPELPDDVATLAMLIDLVKLAPPDSAIAITNGLMSGDEPDGDGAGQFAASPETQPSYARNLALLAMMHLQNEAHEAGDPESNQHLIDVIGDMSPEELQSLFADRKDFAWIAHGTSSNGKTRWKDTSTKQLRYQESMPGAVREKVKASSTAAAHLTGKVMAGTHTHEDLAELATHISALPVAALRNTRASLMASFGNAKKRDDMVAALVTHVKGQADSVGKDREDAADGRAEAYDKRAASATAKPSGGAMEVHPSAPTTDAKPPPATPKPPLEDFADRVHAATQKSLDTTPVGGGHGGHRKGWHGDDLMFISHLHDRMAKDHPDVAAMGLPAFKAKLVEANNARLLTLSRADLVQAMAPKDVGESHVSHGNANYPFVLHQTPEQLAKAGEQSAPPKPPEAAPKVVAPEVPPPAPKPVVLGAAGTPANHSYVGETAGGASVYAHHSGTGWVVRKKDGTNVRLDKKPDVVQSQPEPTQPPPTAAEQSPTVVEHTPSVGSQSANPKQEKPIDPVEMPKLKGSEKQVQWAGDIRSEASKWKDHPGADERLKSAVELIEGMNHAKQLIDLKDVVGHPKQLYATVQRGKELAETIRSNAGKVASKDVSKTLGVLSPEIAAVAYHILHPNGVKYEGYGQTANPMFNLWLTGKLKIPMTTEAK